MDTEQKSIFNLYGVFLAAIMMNFIPDSTVQGIGGLLLIIAVIVAYVYRRRSKDDSLKKTHMHFLIKSFWVSSLVLIVGTAAAFFLADHSVIYELSDSITNGYEISPVQIEETMFTYMKNNLFIFIITLMPSILYLTYRVIKGMVFVKKNQTISTTSWL